MKNRVCEEITIPLYPDFQISAKHWANPQGIPTLMMHGWLDNAASFDLLAPFLPELDLVAIDFPGHGLSSHKPASCFFHILDLVIESFKVLRALNWDSCIIIGHSLGAAVGSLMAGTSPQRVSKLILIDGLGSLTTHAESAPEQLQNYIEQHSDQSSKVPVYSCIEKAMTARKQASQINDNGIKVLVERGIKPVEGGYTWRSDPRLLKPTPLYLTEEQNNAFLKRITAPTLVIRPEPGYAFDPEIMQRRLAAIQNLRLEKLSGGHHIHLDDPASVAKVIHRFL